MRKLFFTLAAATAAISLATPAVALPVVVNPDVSGTPDSYQIFGIASTGNPVYGSSPNNTTIPNVTFTANVATTMDIGNGAAIIKDASATPSWQWIIINPDLNFTDLKFDISLVGSGSVWVYYLLAGGPTSDANNPANYVTQCVTCTFAADGSDNHYELSGASFNGVVLYAPQNTIYSVKQMSYEPTGGVTAVPEPATWGLMLLGFGGMGMALRRSRRRGKRTLMQIA